MNNKHNFFPDVESFIAEAIRLYSLGYDIEAFVVFGAQKPSIDAIDHCLAGLKCPENGAITWLQGFESYQIAMSKAGELVDFAYRFGGEILVKIDKEPNVIYELYNDAMGYYAREIEREKKGE